MLELKRRFYHVDICYRISITKGKPGFCFEARAKNSMDFAYGAFSFSLPLEFSVDAINHMVFSWQENSEQKELVLASEINSFFKIPARKELTISQKGLALKIESEEDKTAAYFVDWSSRYLTPDLHGIYRPLVKGEESKAKWTFSVSR